MAKVKMEGISALMVAFDEMAAVPDDVMFEMLRVGGEVLVKAQQESAESRGLRDTGMMIESIKAGRPRRLRDGGDIGLAPEGTRRRGKTVTRNAEIAYVNEYGTGKRPGTFFIKHANVDGAYRATLAAFKVFENWLEKRVKV